MRPRYATVLVVAALTAAVASADVKGAVQTFLTEGVAALNARNFAEAQTKFKAALGAASTPAEQDEATSWISRALAADNHVEDARGALKAALAKRPSPALAAEYARSLLQYQPVETREAIKFLLPVIDEKKGGYGAKDPEPWLVLGKAYVADKQYPSAIQIYHLLLKIKKDEVRAYTGMADAQILAAKYKDAQDTMDTAMRMFPDNADVLFFAGRVKERDGRLGNASTLAGSYYQSAARAAGGNPRFLAAALFAFLNAGDTTAAQAVAGELHNRAPNDSYAIWFDGLNEEISFHMPQAIGLYEKAVQLNSENAYAHYVLARLYLGLGNKSLRIARTVEPPESFRVTPFRNVARGGQVLATLKYIDPSFPGLQALLDLYDRIQSRSTGAQTLTPEEKHAVEQLINYTTKMNRYR